ncbi:ubiquitin carboxyl-terminal hydrolase 26 isoform X2 [Fundulus heteroclitus]|uniref:ubiquitin carboxyl-terminal hydrolase 26 isoform X2 n=1 Tax=Fundulus heteroclitus TaxID=8078 RepID=UPI00165C28AB|nr:ubiquitin carboxyl-terminal hydrolase 26 isoform X2 [Fundulus heteroclitus]
MSWWSSTEAKYHGLVNHGATCYLNSVLQVLFMTEEFREAVNSPDDNRIDRHLKELFEKLPKRTASTRDILKALDVDNVYEQKDAAEYFERILKKTSENAAQIFHGQLTHRTTCLKCQREADNEGPFWHLPLELGASSGENYSVENGINMFFTPMTFEGENQMYCENCDAKVDATTKYVITHHPDVLLLLLKRFDFSYKYMSYIKINCDVDIPHTLKIPENQTYELYAVVEHVGDLRGGHYTAIIKPKDEEARWYTFNDTHVTPLCQIPFLNNRNTEKSSNAYLLFYRKKGSGTMEACSIRDQNLCTTQDSGGQWKGDNTETAIGNLYKMNGSTQNSCNKTQMKPEARGPGKGELNQPEEIVSVEKEIDSQNKWSDEQRLIEGSKQPDKEVSYRKEDRSSERDCSAQCPESKRFNNPPQKSLNQDGPHLDDYHQRRNKRTADASKTQKQERNDDGGANLHQDSPKVDGSGEGKQQEDQRQTTGNSERDKNGTEKKGDKDYAFRTRKDLSSSSKYKHVNAEEDSQAGKRGKPGAEYSDSPTQPYHHESLKDTQKRQIRQKGQTSHPTQNELDLKKTAKPSDKRGAPFTEHQWAERDKETSQQKLQVDTSEGSQVAAATGHHSKQSLLDVKTVDEKILNVYSSGKKKKKIQIITTIEETLYGSIKRNNKNNEDNITRKFSMADHFLNPFHQKNNITHQRKPSEEQMKTDTVRE